MTYRVPLFRPCLDVSTAVDAVAKVLASGTLTQGDYEALLENTVSYLFGCPVVLTNSCTSALDLALHLAGVTANHIVLTTAQTCTATNSAIVNRGAVPAWVDVDPETGNVTGATLEHWFDENTSPNVHDRIGALVVVDWGGRPCDYDSLRAVLERRLLRPQADWGPRVPIIEDAAHAALATYKQQSIGQVGGDFVCWSFQAIKHMTCGDGGALTCSPPLLDRARKLKWFGIDRRLPGPRFMQDIEEIGFKYHMNDIAAAIGLTSAVGLATRVDYHRASARFLWEQWCSHEHIRQPVFDYGSSYWFASILTEHRASLEAHLDARGIESGEVHRRNDQLTAFKRWALKSATSFDGLDRFSRTQLNLPCGPWMTSEMLLEVAKAVQTWTP